jgi:hypothetical protein
MAAKFRSHQGEEKRFQRWITLRFGWYIRYSLQLRRVIFVVRCRDQPLFNLNHYDWDLADRTKAGALEALNPRLCKHFLEEVCLCVPIEINVIKRPVIDSYCAQVRRAYSLVGRKDPLNRAVHNNLSLLDEAKRVLEVEKGQWRN